MKEINQIQLHSQDMTNISNNKNEATSMHGLSNAQKQQSFAEGSFQFDQEKNQQNNISEQQELDLSKNPHQIKFTCKAILKNHFVNIAIIIFIFFVVILLLPSGQVKNPEKKSISQQQSSTLQDKNVDVLELEKQDNLPQTIEQKVQHKSMDIPVIQSYKVEQQVKLDQDIEQSFHDPNSKNKQEFPQNFPLKCSTYMPYDVSATPQKEYYRWYGKVGKSMYGTLYQTGHLYERHLAVNQKCTSQQKRDKKTVFLNMVQLIKALETVSFSCDLHNHKQFQFSQDGRAYQSIQGIDCKTGQKRSFNSYFILFKRATQNYRPSQDEYMKSMFTTLWTFYPKR